LALQKRPSAFVSGNFLDFMSLLTTNNVVWLNGNIVAYKMHQPFAYTNAPFVFTFDDHTFNVAFRNDPVAADEIIFDMILASLGRRNIATLSIKKSPFGGSPTLMFSPDALDSFLVRNQQLKVSKLSSLKIDDSLCNIIGRKTHCLDTLQLNTCEFDMQLFAEPLGANKHGPRAITLDRCSGPGGGEVAVNFSSVIAPLLANKATEYLCLDFVFFKANNNDYSMVNDAFKSNKALQHLVLDCGFRNNLEVNAIALLFQSIAEAPMLRTLVLKINYNFGDSQQLGCEMFANAMKDCHNSFLEEVQNCLGFRTL
jgi:hypothetical protein